MPAATASPSTGTENPSGKGNRGACHAPIVPYFHGLYWGVRVGPTEKIFPCSHLPTSAWDMVQWEFRTPKCELHTPLKW